MPLPCLPNNLYRYDSLFSTSDCLSFSGMGLGNDYDGLAALLSKVLGVLEHEENNEAGELAIELT